MMMMKMGTFNYESDINVFGLVQSSKNMNNTTTRYS